MNQGLEEDQNRTIIVFDLGGGTLDISILEVSDGMVDVKATSGDTLLGGRDFDNVLVDLCLNAFIEDFGIDLT